ncbi:hypothetical protein GCM10010112_57460 [Actinoplanes lobatus]|uniref:Uncharacterized protein n=1 Tax=Actinoplanes lobatus TaxID=113568 RepID=A0A7W7HCD6_9ACTN|nr:hypothetical protein [Actinoplanes lobatus]MBB4747935.1 hypothetical protein [Actinoplanes lobatus]GGN81250.1 hypothetical protein GCM10010112_57460 [Actinoplanes lobatus]GIE41598.1 hypothetical protein Alo02nite_44960 [Actinoplanes lobatus]
MTITIERTERPAPSPRMATIALGRAEARRVWRSPFLWTGLVLSIVSGLAWSWTRLPTWETFHENSGMAAVVLAAALLITAQMAVARDHRAQTVETMRTMPTGPGRRSLGQLAVVPIAALAGLVLYAAILLLLLPTWPVGRFEPWAAVVVVVIPPIGAAIGLAAGRLLPAAVTGPLAVVAIFLALSVPFVFVDSADISFWPVTFVEWDFGYRYPHGWHLLYLAGLLVSVVALASWPAARRASVAIAAVSVVFAGYAVQHEAAITPDFIDTEAALRRTAPEMLDCRVHAEVRYCALPGYAPWIEYWRDAVEPVAALLPPGARRPSIRQIAAMDDMKPMTPGYPEMIISDSWGRIGGWAEDSRRRMARDYVSAGIGILTREPMTWLPCDASGQHRTVVGLWMLGRAAPGEGWTLPRTRYGQAEIQAAESLLAMPQDRVASYLAEHWSEVLDPSSTALAGLGVTLTPPPIPTEPPALPADGTMAPEDRGVCT